MWRLPSRYLVIFSDASHCFPPVGHSTAGTQGGSNHDSLSNVGFGGSCGDGALGVILDAEGALRGDRDADCDEFPYKGVKAAGLLAENRFVEREERGEHLRRALLQILHVLGICLVIMHYLAFRCVAVLLLLVLLTVTMRRR